MEFLNGASLGERIFYVRTRYSFGSGGPRSDGEVAWDLVKSIAPGSVVLGNGMRFRKGDGKCVGDGDYEAVDPRVPEVAEAIARTVAGRRSRRAAAQAKHTFEGLLAGSLPEATWKAIDEALRGFAPAAAKGVDGVDPSDAPTGAKP